MFSLYYKKVFTYK